MSRFRGQASERNPSSPFTEEFKRAMEDRSHKENLRSLELFKDILPPGVEDLFRAWVAGNGEEARRRSEFFKLGELGLTADRWRRVQEGRLMDSAVDAVKLPPAE